MGDDETQTENDQDTGYGTLRPFSKMKSSIENKEKEDLIEK